MKRSIVVGSMVVLLVISMAALRSGPPREQRDERHPGVRSVRRSQVAG
jgi:hypothetical protein